VICPAFKYSAPRATRNETSCWLSGAAGHVLLAASIPASRDVVELKGHYFMADMVDHPDYRIEDSAFLNDMRSARTSDPRADPLHTSSGP